MFYKLIVAAVIAAILMYLEKRHQQGWAREEWGALDLLIRVGVWVPWTLGVIALGAAVVGVIVR